MRRRYVRTEPGRKENLAAAVVSGALATGVGLVAFYLVRLLLARDAVGPSGADEDQEAGDGAPAVE